jgi:hypothetical protein
MAPQVTHTVIRHDTGIPPQIRIEMHKPKQFHIPLEMLLEAQKCNKHHACLTSEDYQLCGIRITTENHARMVCGTNNDCPYSSPIGNQIVCTCPVRHAIHRKYGI